MNIKRFFTAFTLFLMMVTAFTFGHQPVAAQATLTVGVNDPSINADGLCSLEEAVANANNNAATHADCPAGTGTGMDVIDLDGRTITFTTGLAAHDLDGHNALPPIIDGLILANGTIERSAALTTCDGGAGDRNEFRLIYNLTTLTLDEITLQNGCASDVGAFVSITEDIDGGGIYNFGTLSVANSTIAGHTATGNGGGISNNNTLFVNNSMIAGNQTVTGIGGGIDSPNSAGGLVINNSVISGNFAASDGGGVHSVSPSIITNATIVANRAGTNGGGYDGSTNSHFFANSILWGNLPSEFDDAGSNLTFNYSSIGNIFVGSPTLSNTTTGIDPLFVSQQSAASAPTTAGDYSVQENSPVIDSGDNVAANNAGFTDGITFDVVGSDRFVDDPGVVDAGNGTAPIIDRGAYEYQGVSNLSPTAAFTFICTGLDCDFDASTSTDSDGTITDYDWDFGDLTTGIGAITSRTFTAAGDYDVELTVTDDDGAVDTITQTVTVQNLPVIAAIGDQTVAVGYSIIVPISASDADGEIPSLSVSSVDIATPGTFTYSFVDNADGTGSLTVSPQAGVTAQTYVMTVTASDGIEQNTLDFNLIVTANPAPVLDPYANQSASVGQTLTLPINATDDSIPISVSLGALIYDVNNDLISVSPLGDGNFYIVVDNGDGTGDLTITPQTDDDLLSPYRVEVSALDDFGNLTIETFTLTVAAQAPPVFDPVPDIMVGETENRVVTITATDINLDPLTLSTVSVLPSFASFSDLGGGVGELTLAPIIGDAGGPFTITLQVDDPFASAQISFDVTVVPNGAPVFDVPISNVFVGVDATRTVDFSAFDPEGNPITFMAEILDSFNNPVTPGAFIYSLTDNGDGTGSVTITPQTGTEGTYTIIIQAEDGLESTVSSSTLTVAVNNPPTIPNPGDQTVSENGTLTVPIIVTDTEGDAFTVTLDGISPDPGWIVFTDLGGGNVQVTANPPNASAGTYAVTIRAEDIWGASTETFNIIVANTAPTVTTALNITITEGDTTGAVSFSATDAEGNPISFPSVEVLDAGLNPVTAGTFVFSFTDNTNGTGSVTISPVDGTAGTYTLRITASDGAAQSTNDFPLEVIANQPPAITPIADQTVFENTTLTVPITITATEGDPFTYNLVSIVPDPGYITYNDLGNGNAEIVASPPLGATGTFTITITASDAFATATETFDITVANAAPTFDAPFVNVSVKEGETSGAIPFSATDAEGDPITFTAEVLDGGGNPVVAGTFVYTFTDNTDGTGEISFSPTVGTLGVYTVNITASDATSSSVGTFTLNVTDNDPPVINPIADQIMVELQVLDIPIVATDIQGDPITLTATLAPNNGFLSLVDNGDGTGTLTLNPPIGNLGVYTVTVTADDTFGNSSIIFTVTVADNVAPTIAAFEGEGLVPVLDVPLPDPITITEGEFFLVDVIANDADGDPVTITGEIFDAANNPVSGTLFNVVEIDQGNGILFYDPSALGGSVGTYDLVFTASDGFLSTSITYTLIVLNQEPPVISPIADVTITEGDILIIPLSATDAEADEVFFEEIGTYPDFAFIASADLVLTPLGGDAGTYVITVGATDLIESSQTSFTVTVIPNTPPVPTPIEDVVMQSGQILDVVFVVDDINDDELFFEVITDLPGFAVLNGNVLTIAPPLEVSGSFPVTVRVSDGVDFADFSFNVDILIDLEGVPVSEVILLGSGSTGSNTGFNVSSIDNTGVVGSGQRGDEEAEATNNASVVNNTPPVAENDTITVLAGESILIDVVENDTLVQDSGDVIGVTVINQPTLGFANSEDGQIRFSAPETISGNIALTYTVTDSTGLSSQEATVTIEVLPYNPSVAFDIIPSSQEVFEGDDAVITITLTNDGTIDLPTLSLTNVFETRAEGQPFAESTCLDETFDLLVGEIRIIECNETQITSDYSRVFLLENALIQERLSAAFEVVTRNVLPVANDDEALTLVNTAVSVNVLLNDTDEDGALDPATVRVVEDLIIEARSIFVDQLTGRIEVDPVENFEGDITFTYEVCDDRGDCDTATVTVTVQAQEIIPEFAVDFSKTGSVVNDEAGNPTNRVEWVISFSNVGTADGANVVLTDTVNSQLSIDDVVTNLGAVVIEGQTVTVSLPSMAIGETVQVRVLTSSTVGSASVNNEVCISADNLSEDNCLTSDTVNIVAPIEAETQAVDGEGTTNTGIPPVVLALSCLVGAILLAIAGFFIWRSRQNA